ncbi:hypothetical protein QSV34_12280 [Porticoccus sp. W117]|nr:hypothetical protein [Porticoccus sp. W117]
MNDLNKDLENPDEAILRWLRPIDVSGVDSESLLKLNEKKWFATGLRDDENETADEIITDYLRECLSRQDKLVSENKDIPKDAVIDAKMLVDAAIFLICFLGSSYAATLLSWSRELISPDNASDCLVDLSEAYANSQSFVRDILRDFILEIYRYGPLWGDEGREVFNTLNDDQQLFLKTVFDDGYLTIDKNNARLFESGQERWSNSNKADDS